MEQTTNDLWESFIKEQQEEETLDGSISEYEQDIKKMMIEFAKLHVEAALKEASEKAKMIDVGIDYSIILWEVDKDSILNSYPLENIK